MSVKSHGVEGALRKRKERESNFDDVIKPSKLTPTATTPIRRSSKKETEPAKDNRLLAGYLAHEFLTQGTLLGQKWDPAKAEAVPISPRKPSLKMRRTAEMKVAPTMVPRQTYAEVANLLKCDGVHIEEIVNPTQLARWLQM